MSANRHFQGGNLRNKRFAVSVLVLMLALAGTTSASASRVMTGDERIVPVEEVFPDGSGITYGGTTQSEDPTRFDYVEPVDPDLVTPYDATGGGFVPAFSFVWGGITISVPGGVIDHTIKGSGLTITKETAAFGPLVPTFFQICNYQWVFQNRFGSTVYSNHWLPLQSGCHFGNLSATSSTVKRTVKTGQVCARLFVNGTYKGEQCHNVYP